MALAEFAVPPGAPDLLAVARSQNGVDITLEQVAPGLDPAEILARMAGAHAAAEIFAAQTGRATLILRSPTAICMMRPRFGEAVLARAGSNLGSVALQALGPEPDHPGSRPAPETPDAAAAPVFAAPERAAMWALLELIARSELPRVAVLQTAAGTMELHLQGGALIETAPGLLDSLRQALTADPAARLSLRPGPAAAGRAVSARDAALALAGGAADTVDAWRFLPDGWPIAAPEAASMDALRAAAACAAALRPALAAFHPGAEGEIRIEARGEYGGFAALARRHRDDILEIIKTSP